MKKDGMGGVCCTYGSKKGWDGRGNVTHVVERWVGHDIHMGEKEDEMGGSCYTRGRGGRGMICTWERMRTRWAWYDTHMGEKKDEMGGACYTHGREMSWAIILYLGRGGQGILYTCNRRKVKWVWHVIHIWEEEDWMGGARYTLGKDETCVQNFSKSLATCVRRWDLKKFRCGVKINISGSR